MSPHPTTPWPCKSMVPRENRVILTQGCRIAFLGQPVIGSRSLEAPGSLPAFHTARWPPSLLFLQAGTHCQQPRAFYNLNSAFTSKFLTRLPGSGTKARLSVAGRLHPCDTSIISQPVHDLNTPTDSWGCPSAARLTQDHPSDRNGQHGGERAANETSHASSRPLLTRGER